MGHEHRYYAVVKYENSHAERYQAANDVVYSHFETLAAGSIVSAA